MRTARDRWFKRLAVLFAAWNLVGAASALGVAILWSKRISEEPISTAPMIHALVFASVAALALLAVARLRTNGRKWWWAAVAFSLGEWVVGVVRFGPSLEDWTDLAILAFVVVVASFLLRRPPDSAGDEAAPHPALQ
jgi:hypothetical protein